MPPRRPLHASCLADALGDAGPRLVAALYARWATERDAPGAGWLDLFRLAQGDATQRGILSERGAALAVMVGAPVDGEDAQHGAILAAQTAVALVARLLALRVTEPLAPADPGLATLRGASDAAIHAALAQAGRTLEDRGVRGLLEGDPFGWAVRSDALAGSGAAAPARDAADRSLADALRAVIAVVAALPTPALREGAPVGAAEDHFAALTQALVPAPVRHALGEFYTPAWLADLVVDGALAHAGPPSGWRGLDPCCGSGAFLLALARRVLAETRAAPRAERLRAVLDRIAGVDVHPLAVLTARVNLLVACAPLLAPGDAVSIAVVRGDATLAGLPPRAAPLAAPLAAPHGGPLVDPGAPLALVPPDLGRFTVVVGNPPWVDWKRLPPAQRAALRDTGVARALYSGDGFVGGVSLNVCAIVASVAADAWLAEGGVLGLLLPRSLAIQPSYAAFRALRRKDGGRRHVVAFDDWSGVGHPFAPVSERFLTWYVGDRAPGDTVPVTHHRRRPGVEPGAPGGLVRDPGVAGPVGAGTAFTFATDRAELRRFDAIAGECAYVGREGVEFYPQEVWLFEVLGPAGGGRVRVRNFQGGKSRYRVPARELELEAAWLHPLVKGVDVGRFRVATSGLVVPFPYAPGARLPVPIATLREEAPALAAWLHEHAPLLGAQSAYNARIVGRADAEPHALARVGRYSFADTWVAFRDNTTWGASVVTRLDTTWGGPRAPRFQNHAVSMCERADGAFLAEEEAHYVCAALNAPIVGRFLAASSDARSFKIRPPVRVPLHDADNPLHAALAALSRRGHAGEGVDGELDRAYLRVVTEG